MSINDEKDVDWMLGRANVINEFLPWQEFVRCVLTMAGDTVTRSWDLRWGVTGNCKLSAGALARDSPYIIQHQQRHVVKTWLPLTAKWNSMQAHTIFPHLKQPLPLKWRMFHFHSKISSLRSIIQNIPCWNFRGFLVRSKFSHSIVMVHLLHLSLQEQGRRCTVVLVKENSFRWSVSCLTQMAIWGRTDFPSTAHSWLWFAKDG